MDEIRDIGISHMQASVLAGIEQRITTALRDRQVAVMMVLAAHEIESAELLSLNAEGRSIRIKLPRAE